jgi:hypothetical protein
MCLVYTHGSGTRQDGADYLRGIAAGEDVYREISHGIDRLVLLADSLLVYGWTRMNVERRYYAMIQADVTYLSTIFDDGLCAGAACRRGVRQMQRASEVPCMMKRTPCSRRRRGSPKTLG